MEGGIELTMLASDYGPIKNHFAVLVPLAPVYLLAVNPRSLTMMGKLTAFLCAKYAEFVNSSESSVKMVPTTGVEPVLP